MNIDVTILDIVLKNNRQYAGFRVTGWREQWFHPTGINGDPLGRSIFLSGINNGCGHNSGNS
jgi:hypothetical protein